MRLSCALLFAASLVTNIAHAAPDESLYRGTIGKSPIRSAADERAISGRNANHQR